MKTPERQWRVSIVNFEQVNADWEIFADPFPETCKISSLYKISSSSH